MTKERKEAEKRMLEEHKNSFPYKSTNELNSLGEEIVDVQCPLLEREVR